MVEFIKNLFKTKEKTKSSEPKLSWWQRLKKGVSKTADFFHNNISNLLLGAKKIDQSILDGIKKNLIQADCGAKLSEKIIQELYTRINRSDTQDGAKVLAVLKEILLEILEKNNNFNPMQNKESTLQVIFFVGVNGNGKTTNLAKIANRLQKNDKKVMVAAGDTYRKAAIEQLEIWCERTKTPMISQHIGADSASVIYDAINSAKAKNYDYLLADTAGRLHNQDHLINELKKIKKVALKLIPEEQLQIALVLDATVGQNAINQATIFTESIGANSVVLTKLDGTAKGGIVFALAEKFNLPISYIGVGEQIEDLREFCPKEFISALFE